MKVLVFGKNGQVGRCLQDVAWPTGFEVTFLSREDVDLTDVDAIGPMISKYQPDWVVNASAYTAVDKAEEEEEDLALLINAQAPEKMAQACEEIGAAFLHISTDYVFNGEGEGAYTPEDPIAPLGAYGRSKALGEEGVVNACTKHVIMRTAWVYSPYGGNFVKTMLRLAQDRDELGIVSDQRGCPTSAHSIAQSIVSVVSHDHPTWGIYHYCDEGAVSWHEFACYIFEASAGFGAKVPSKVNAIMTSDYPTPAKRPANSVLDCSKIVKAFGLVRPEWTSETSKVVKALLS